MSKEYDIIIIGAGVAGMNAALNSIRGGKSVLIIEKNTYGGQAATSPRIENFPSIESISGLELCDRFFNQIIEKGVEFELENVLEIKKNNDVFKITTDYNEYFSKVCIIATGVKHKNINLPNEKELIGKGISTCAICDGAFFEGEDVCIVGDGNTAMQYALLLANTSKHVYLCTLFNKFFGEKIYEERIFKRNNITVIQNVSLIKINGKEKLESLIFKNTETCEELEIKCKGLFIAIGNVPDNKKFNNLVSLDNEGYIITNDKMETETNGLYAIGDCRKKDIRQITTAISDGSIASFNAINYIETINTSK